MPSSGSTLPTLVIGLDGATFRVLRPWLESGELPCLSRLYNEGVSGVLESITPPLSPEAWSTFMTGKHPGLHGVMNFICFLPGTYQVRFNNGAMIREKTLWRLISDAGMRVGVAGVPMTYPPEAVNGYLVSGLETPGISSQFTHPESLAEELRSALGGYDLHGDFVDCKDPAEYLSRLLDTVKNQARAACYLLKRHPADLSVFVIGATDRVQHAFWRYLGAGSEFSDAIKTAYKYVDDAVAEMIEQIPDPKNVVVMSDHGFGPCHTMVHLNRWLEQRGYLTFARRHSAGSGVLRGLYRGANAAAPRWLKDAVKSRLPGIRRKMTSFLLFSDVDWPESRAFAISTQHGYVYLNRRDRFPLGTVEPGAEADEIREQLAAELSKMQHPETGEPLVARVLHTKREYQGPACDLLPDLIVLWRDGYISRAESGEIAKSRAKQNIVEPTGRALGEWSGSHRFDGVLIAHGPAFASPRVVEGARLVDLAPTLLHLLGLPVPDDMTGRVLDQLFDERFLGQHLVRYVASEREERPDAPAASLTPEESEQVAERLRRMGYL